MSPPYVEYFRTHLPALLSGLESIRNRLAAAAPTPWPRRLLRLDGIIAGVRQRSSDTSGVVLPAHDPYWANHVARDYWTLADAVKEFLPQVRYVVEVTQTDIDCGTPDCPGLCPVASAVQRAIGGVGFQRGVAVTDAAVALLSLAGDFVARLPASARRFIRDFDAGRVVEPFTFRLHPLRPVRFDS